MELINFKVIDDENIFCFNDVVDFDVVINAFTDKIIQLKENKKLNNNLLCTIDFGKRKLTPNELLLFFDVVTNEKYLLISKINCVNKINSQIEIVEGTIRAGNYLTFNNSVLILGDVNPNSTIIAKNNIYIVGKSYGKLISLSKEGKISASSFINSIIQIYNSNLEIINTKECVSLEYEDENIKIIRNMQSKGENNVKSNCSYIR